MDLDGVLVNWIEAAFKINGHDVDDPEIRSMMKADYEIASRFVDDNFWEAIDAKGHDFWSELEFFPWAMRLHELCEEHGSVYFLTSPNEYHGASSGKHEFILREFGTHKTFLIGKPKFLCANSRSLLIDDFEKNIIPWREAGGKAFLWPNAHKIIDGEISLDEVFEDLEWMIKGMIQGRKFYNEDT